MKIESYKDIINNFYNGFVFPLLGMTKNEITDIQFDVEIPNSMLKEANFEKNNSFNMHGIKIPYPQSLKEGDEKNLYVCISEVFLSILKSNETILKPNKSYLPELAKRVEIEDSLYLDSIYNYSIQKGICKWISSDYSSNIEKLLKVLDTWSKKTYEGHKVCFGFVVDLDDKSNNEKSLYSNSFIDFLEDDFSAVLSDGFSSLIKLNTYCEYKGFESLTANNKIEECILSNYKLPYRFAQIISKNAINNQIVIILLQNSDIILAKNKEIKFIKRNNKWLNFSVNAFIKSINSNYKKPLSLDIERIYSTCIDVSLSHVGGIIAAVKDINEIKEIISKIDIIDDEEEDELFFQEFELKCNDLLTENERDLKNQIAKCIKYKEKRELDVIIDASKKRTELYNLKVDIINRLTKRKYIIKLLSGKRNLIEIDRKLFAELVSLDGACILDLSGNIISFGAIIKNDSGSTGGGRGAAAKKLSNYGGFAIKISTDGYIELYINGKKVYAIK